MNSNYRLGGFLGKYNKISTHNLETKNINYDSNNIFSFESNSINFNQSLIPSGNNILDIGSPDNVVRDLYLGPDSLFVNGKKILQDKNGEIQFTTSPGDNLGIEVSNSGTLQFKSGSGDISLYSSEADINLTTDGTTQGINLKTLGTSSSILLESNDNVIVESTTILNGKVGILTTDINYDLDVLGNINSNHIYENGTLLSDKYLTITEGNNIYAQIDTTNIFSENQTINATLDATTIKEGTVLLTDKYAQQINLSDYAFSSTDITTSDLPAEILTQIEGDNRYLQQSGGTVTGQLKVIDNGENIKLEGTDHVYMAFYPEGSSSGRKAYIGFPNATTTELAIRNQYTGGIVNIYSSIKEGGTLLTDKYAQQSNLSGYAFSSTAITTSDLPSEILTQTEGDNRYAQQINLSDYAFSSTAITTSDLPSEILTQTEGDNRYAQTGTTNTFEKKQSLSLNPIPATTETVLEISTGNVVINDNTNNDVKLSAPRIEEGVQLLENKYAQQSNLSNYAFSSTAISTSDLPNEILTQTEGDNRYAQQSNLSGYAFSSTAITTGDLPSEILTQTEGDNRYAQQTNLSNYAFSSTAISTSDLPSEILTQTEGDNRYAQTGTTNTFEKKQSLSLNPIPATTETVLEISTGNVVINDNTNNDVKLSAPRIEEGGVLLENKYLQSGDSVDTSNLAKLDQTNTFSEKQIIDKGVVVNNSTNGSSAQGVRLWDDTDTDWGIYLGESGDLLSLSDGTATNGGNFTSYAVRLRAESNAGYGFIFENHLESNLMSIKSDDGEIYIPNLLGIGAVDTYDDNDGYHLKLGGGNGGQIKLGYNRGYEFAHFIETEHSRDPGLNEFKIRMCDGTQYNTLGYGVGTALMIDGRKHTSLNSTATNGYILNVNGDVMADAYDLTSDDRLKENEEYIENATETLLKLRPQIYNKHLKNQEEYDGTQYIKECGLIAQEVYYDVPELKFLINVPETAENIEEPPEGYDNKDIQNDPDYSNWGETYATLNYTGLIPYLIQGFKEMVNKVNKLEDEKNKEIKELLERIKVLEEYHKE